LNGPTNKISRDLGDDFEKFGPDRWTEIDPAWVAPELDLGDGRRLVLAAPDPFPEDELAFAGVN